MLAYPSDYCGGYGILPIGTHYFSHSKHLIFPRHHCWYSCTGSNKKVLAVIFLIACKQLVRHVAQWHAVRKAWKKKKYIYICHGHGHFHSWHFEKPVLGNQLETKETNWYFKLTLCPCHCLCCSHLPFDIACTDCSHYSGTCLVSLSKQPCLKLRLLGEARCKPYEMSCRNEAI